AQIVLVAVRYPFTQIAPREREFAQVHERASKVGERPGGVFLEAAETRELQAPLEIGPAAGTLLLLSSRADIVQRMAFDLEVTQVARQRHRFFAPQEGLFDLPCEHVQL